MSHSLKKGLAVLSFLVFCTSIIYSQEGGIPGGCTDGIDNDGDGLVDCKDGDCAGVVAECPAFNLSSVCSPSGGIRADIIGVETAYRASGGGAVTIPIPTGATGAIVYTSSVDVLTGSNDLNQGNEDFINSSAVLNLSDQTSSGVMTYAQSTATNSSGTTLFGWKNVAFGSKVSTGAASGHDSNSPLNDLTFSVSGSTLTITEDNTSIKTSYLVEFTSSTSNSLISKGFESLALNAGTYTGSVNIPTGTDIVIISTKGTGTKNHSNASNGGEEPFSDMRFIVDMSTNLTDGFVTVVNGGAIGYHSTYAFEGHDFLSTTDSLWDAPTIAGDYAGKVRATDGGTGTANFTVYQTALSPNELVLGRDPNYGADFDDVYIFEFFSRTGLPMSAEFIETQLAFYDDGSPSGSSESFSVPSGSNFAIFKMGGLAENANVTHNENPVNAYAFIDLNTETANGYYFQQVGLSGGARRDHNFAFKAVPLNNSSTRTHANTIGKTSAAAEYDISFQLSTDKKTLSVTCDFGLVATEYKAVMIADFFGSKSDVAFNSSNVAISESGNCPTVDVSIELCNPGAGNSPLGVPIAFYDGDPTMNANAVLLDVATFGTAVEVGSCATEVIEVDLSTIPNKNIDITAVINDDGSFANGVGNPLGKTIDLDTLDRQGNLLLECDFSNNLVTKTIAVNNCPSTSRDEVTTNTNTIITINVQSNDSDPDGDGLTTSILTNGKNGTAIIVGNDVQYSPNTDFSGIDTIVYQVSDGNGGLASDSIFVTVSATLPIELTGFLISVQDCHALIEWTATNALGFSHFELEESIDGVRFTTVEIVNISSIQTIHRHSYQTAVTDRDKYYRLRMVDLDGSYSLSPIKTLSKRCQVYAEVEVFPNPVNQEKAITVKFTPSNEQFTGINIINTQGSLVHTMTVPNTSNAQSILIDISHLPQGVYFLKVNDRIDRAPVLFVKTY